MKISDMSVEYIDHMGSDLSVVNAARVSFSKRVDVLSEKDVKLIKYLANHKHTSPFNHAFLTVKVKAPIFVARQLVKHKFMPWNEVSRRYVDDEPEFYIPKVLRERAENKKQGSGGIYKDEIWTCSSFGAVGSTIKEEINILVDTSLSVYKDALQRGVCPEQARMVLPLNAMTEWYWSGTLGAFIDMLRLRLDPHTQWETGQVALSISGIVQDKFPHSYAAFFGDN